MTIAKLPPEIEGMVKRLEHLESRAFTDEEKSEIIEAYKFFKSSWIVFGAARRFIIGLAALIVAISAVMHYVPWGKQ